MVDINIYWRVYEQPVKSGIQIRVMRLRRACGVAGAAPTPRIDAGVSSKYPESAKAKSVKYCIIVGSQQSLATSISD